MKHPDKKTVIKLKVKKISFTDVPIIATEENCPRLGLGFGLGLGLVLGLGANFPRGQLSLNQFYYNYNFLCFSVHKRGDYCQSIYFPAGAFACIC